MQGTELPNKYEGFNLKLNQSGVPKTQRRAADSARALAASSKG